MVKQLCILGSTGSIGTQTLDVVRAYPERYSVYALCANRSIDKLVEQASEFRPEVVCIADETLYEELSHRLSDVGFEGKIWSSDDAEYRHRRGCDGRLCRSQTYHRGN